MQLTDSSQLKGLSLLSIKTITMMRILITKGCAKGLKTSKFYQSKKEKNVYVLTIARILMYGCPKCWCQVLHHKQPKQFQLQPTVTENR